MKIVSLCGVLVINFAIGCWYIVLLRRRRISPALAMWVFFTIATVGSLMTYLAQGAFTLRDNVLNASDIVLVAAVSIGILVYGDRSTRFSRFDLGCLAAVVAILIGWAITRQHVVAHSAIQAILVIAYLPVIHRLWKTRRNTESYGMWFGLMLAPVFGLLSSRGTLATVYAVRAIASSALLLLLMARVQWKAAHRSPATPSETEPAQPPA
ncbi:hypothetical protein JW848_06300 [Candidatus Bipolaricaulota bacterium]|nr:hypothetical protein [Candidatus Bipolaricaulota bacterium]